MIEYKSILFCTDFSANGRAYDDANTWKLMGDKGELILYFLVENYSALGTDALYFVVERKQDKVFNSLSSWRIFSPQFRYWPT